jgi:hypothetical protein
MFNVCHNSKLCKGKGYGGYSATECIKSVLPTEKVDRQHSGVLNVRSLRVTDFDNDNYLVVAQVRKTVVSKQTFHMERCKQSQELKLRRG